MKPAYGKTFVNATLLANIAKHSVMIGLREYAVRRVAGELVPLVVVDEDRRDIVVFVDQFDLNGPRHMLLRAAQARQAILVVCGFSLLVAARANGAP